MCNMTYLKWDIQLIAVASFDGVSLFKKITSLTNIHSWINHTPLWWRFLFIGQTFLWKESVSNGYHIVGSLIQWCPFNRLPYRGKVCPVYKALPFMISSKFVLCVYAAVKESVMILDQCILKQQGFMWCLWCPYKCSPISSVITFMENVGHW